MAYVDGFVLPIPIAKIDAYKAMAETAATVWREHGALEYREWIADDVKPGKLTSFPQSVNLEDGETVVFAWITYASREQRDQVNARVMQDPRMAEAMDPATFPFDGKRMIYGGFSLLVAR